MGYSKVCFTFSITLNLKVGKFTFFFNKVEKRSSFSKKRERSGKTKSFGGKEWEMLPFNF